MAQEDLDRSTDPGLLMQRILCWAPF